MWMLLVSTCSCLSCICQSKKICYILMIRNAQKLHLHSTLKRNISHPNIQQDLHDFFLHCLRQAILVQKLFPLPLHPVNCSHVLEQLLQYHLVRQPLQVGLGSEQTSTGGANLIKENLHMIDGSSIEKDLQNYYTWFNC